MKKVLALFLAVLLTAAVLTGCSSGESSGGGSQSSPTPTSGSSGSSGGSSGGGSSGGGGSSSGESGDEDKKGNITISGSTALQPLLTQAVDPFKSKQKFTGAVTVDGGGSAHGLNGVMSEAMQVGASDISPQQAGLDETGLVDHQVAVVLVGVAVSADVYANLTEISVSDLKGIFTGAITDWKQVAGWKGADLPIAVFYQKPGSGIRVIFETYGIFTQVTDEQIGMLPNFTMLDNQAALDAMLATSKGGIGYAAYPYCSKLKLLKVDSIEPSYDNVYSGKYKIWACEHLYTKGEPNGPVKAFLEFLKDSNFEDTITENGYGLISEMKVSR